MKALEHGEIHNDLVVMNSVQVTLREEINMKFTNGQSINSDEGTVVPCPMNSNGCGSSIETYAWQAVQTECNYVKLKTAKGTITKKKNFISMEQNLFLKIKSESTQCGLTMLKTNLPEVFLVEESSVPILKNNIKQFEETDVNLVDFIIARDDFVAYLSRLEVSKATHLHQQKLCEFIQQANSADITISQDTGLVFPTGRDGIFIRAKGDVMDEFQCLPVTVHPRDATTCTKELPVVYNNTEMYLIPGSRILTSTKTLMPCSNAGAPEFKTLSKRLIASTPKIIFTSQPNKRSLWLDPEDEVGTDPEDTKLQDNVYSLYTQDEMEAYAHHLNFPRQVSELTSTFAFQRCMNGQNCGTFSINGESTPFIHTSDLGMLENGDILGIVKNFFYRGIVANFTFLYDWGLRILTFVFFLMKAVNAIFSIDLYQMWKNRRKTNEATPQQQIEPRNMTVSLYPHIPSAPIEPV